MMSLILISLINVLVVFGGVAFFTLLERKVLSYSQNRKGPNKVSFLGLLQPVSDAIKLMIKSFGSLSTVKTFDFFFFPLWSLMMMILFWLLMSPSVSFFFFSNSILLLMIFLSLKVFPVLGSGWSSKSKYAFLGAVRGAAQSISYEVALVFFIIWVCFFFSSLNFKFFSINLVYVFPVFWVLWFIVMVCETNRAPFDFAEGESELVSGFKVEYGSFPFALLFLAEYGVMLFLSVLTAKFFISSTVMNMIFAFLVSVLFLFFRTSFPRFRYDLLMEFCWGICLPLTFVMMFLMFLFF